MKTKFHLLLITVITALTAFGTASAQETGNQLTIGPTEPGAAQEYMQRTGYVIFQGDTMPAWYLKEFVVVGEYLSKDRANQMARLRHNVYKVYPYAVEAARILNELDIEMKKADGRRDRKKYLKAVEQQLNEKFKDKLKNLSTTQGAILVKLINRQSGRDVYSVIKELKGGFSARLSQTAFYFYDNDLKAQYDPYNKDKDIEKVVREIEEKAYYNHQIQNTQILKISGK